MLTNAEFQSILADTSKRIVGDIEWQTDEDHSPSVEFRVEVENSQGYPLFIRGSYNPEARALTFAMILKSVGRVYSLDLGAEHPNPDGTRVGRTHKQRWSERFRDKEAYEPPDITKAANDPVGVWVQFCAEAAIAHDGRLHPPPPREGDLWA